MMHDNRHPDETEHEADPVLQRIEEMLVEAFRVEPSADLLDRVHAASVEHLPAPRPLPFTAQTTSRTPLWGRFAVAAALLFSFVLASRLANHPGQPVSSFNTADATAFEVSWLAGDEVEKVDRQVALVLGSMSISSFDDLTGELGVFFPDLGM